MEKASTTTIPFNSLSPISDYERHKEYCDALEWALSNRKEKDIKNIALTGTYGSGKSSIIKTLEDRNRENKDLHFLKISLATFKEELEFKSKNIDDNPVAKKKRKSPKSKVDQLRLIELSILQQIFYHEKHDKIPESRFKKIRKLEEVDLHFTATLIIGLLITFTFAFYFDTLKSNLKLDYIPPFSETIAVFFTSLAFLAILFFVLKKGLKLSRKWTINKLNFHNLEIEVDNKSTKSILNNHLDEILYFFEATEYNVVIIEDLDRFEQTEIFTKLREINLLLNNSKAVNREIVFIYAVRDEMFKNSDRTKFFDFIIPVIPIINYSNSKEKLSEALKAFGYKISSELIKDVAFYVGDMRLLYNIVNEFHIYFQKFKGEKYVDKLFAIIVYKNIHPEDFALLGRNDGVLYDYLKVKKGIWIKENTLKIEKDIGELKVSISKIENVFPKTLRELHAIFMFEILTEIRDYRDFKINDQSKSADQMLEDENFISLTTNTAQYRAPNGYTQNLPSQFSEIEKRIDDKENYKEKRELIEKRKANKIGELKLKIQKLDIEKKSVRTKKIKDLLIQQLIKTTDEQTKQDQIIILLLRNGYIAEDYLAYISYFHPGSLTEEDHWFLMNVKNDVENEFDYKLNQLQNLIEEINEFHFSKVNVLNYDIVDFFLESDHFEDKKATLFNQMSDESPTSIDFINGFIENGKCIENFIEVLCGKWEGIWKFLDEDIFIEDERRLEYLKLIIAYAKVEDIKKIQNKSNLKAFIANTKDFLLFNFNEDKLKRVISALEIKFQLLEFDKVSDDLKKFIYENDYYAINPEMLSLMLNERGALKQTEFDTANYTAIHKSGCEELINYVDGDIQDYISEVYLQIESNTNEEIEFLLKILNNDAVDMDSKKEIIKRSETRIADIRKIVEQDDLVDYVLANSKISITWENVINYYLNREKGFNETLLEFLNNEGHCEILSKSNLPIEKDENKEFIRKFSLTDEIENELYDHYLKSFKIRFIDLSFEGLSPEKVGALIRNKKISFNKTHYDLLISDFDDLHIQFIENNKTKFFDLFDELTLKSGDIMNLLLSNELDTTDKIKLVEKCDENILFSNPIVLRLIGKATLTIPSFTNNVNLLKSILLESFVDNKDRIGLFNIKNSLLDKEFIPLFLRSLGGKYEEVTQKGPRPSFEKTDYNLNLFNHLESINYISKSIEKANRIKVTTFRS